MSQGADRDEIAEALIGEAATVMPPKRWREFRDFINRLRPTQHDLRLGRPQ